MAIGIHVARWQKSVTDSVVEEVMVEDESIANTADSPTVAEYLALEAEDGYACNHVGHVGNLVVTYNVADMNDETGA